MSARRSLSAKRSASASFGEKDSQSLHDTCSQRQRKKAKHLKISSASSQESLEDFDRQEIPFTCSQEGSVFVGVDDADNNQVKCKYALSHRVARPCVLCNKLIKNLTRHLKKVHKDDTAVQAAVQQPSKAKNRAFQALKRAGIMKFNEREIGLPNSVLMRERSVSDANDDDLSICGKCKYNTIQYNLHL